MVTRDLVAWLPSVARRKIRVALSALRDAGCVRERGTGKWLPANRKVSAEDFSELARRWQERAEGDQEKLRRMEAYARSAPCRWRLVHDYFEEAPPEERCGTCDNCRRGLAQLAEKPVAEVESPPMERDTSADAEPELDVGARVSLPRYGAGEVEKVDHDALVVRFPDGKSRNFKREFARPLPRAGQKM